MTQKNKPSKKAASKAVKKSTKGSKKGKTLLGSLSQTHGKEEKCQPTTLDQIWGDKGSTKYGTVDVNEYVRKLENMNTSDLQSHAHKMGLIPVDDRVTITKKLVYEFKTYISGFRKPDQKLSSIPPISNEAKKILDEGR